MSRKHALNSRPPNILIVDDEIAGLRLLTDILNSKGYRVRPTERPKSAIESAMADPPSLILLDVKMPEMSGFEVCRRLKQEERTKDIPIIFVSGLQDAEDRIRGFKAGGVDFISKPFQESEILARVETHLNLHCMQMHLEDLVKERTSELMISNKSLQTEIYRRNMLEDSLRERRDFLKNLTDSMADVVFSVKIPERKLEWLNDAFKIFGYDPDDCIGKTTEFLYRDRADFLASGDRMAEFIADDEQDILRLEQMFKKKDGEVFPTNLTITKYRVNNEVISITGIMRDITEHKKAETKLRESEEKFKTLVTRNEEIIFMIAKDGTFLLSEGKGLSKLGLKSGQVVGESVFELYKEYPQMLTEMRKAFNGETVTVEAKVSGNYFRNWYTPHKDSNGNTLGLLGLSVNITERKKAEAKLKTYQERLKTLASQSIIAEEKERSRIAADLHDNIGQTLAFARIQVARAKKNATKEDKLTTILDEISQSLLGTIQETKDLVFDLSSPLLHEIGLGAAISNWLEEQVGRKNSIMVNFVHNDKELSLNTDMRLILFRNVRELLCNVIKHAQATEVVVSLASNEEELVIIVRDNGIGFDSDSQVNCIGIDTGFGLFSVKQQIEDFGGRLEIDSKAGKGCKATLRVPINR